MSEAIIPAISPLDGSGGGFCARCRCRCRSCDCDKAVCAECGCTSILPEDAFT